MPGGLNLGGAFFTIYGDNEQLLRTMAQARAATDTATKAMGNAQKAYATAAASSNATVIRMNVEVAEQWVRTAQVASGALRDNMAVLDAYGVKVAGVGKAAGQAGTGLTQFGAAAKRTKKDTDDAGGALAKYNVNLQSIGATLATLTGFGAIASGTLVIRESVLGVVAAAQELNQEQFRMNKLFGAAAPIYAQQAAALAQLSGKSLTDATGAINTLASAQHNWGVSSADAARLQTVVADASAVSGKTLVDIAGRIGPALTGEAESVEILGFALQSDYLQALTTVGSEEQKAFERMGPRAKQRAILNELMTQAARIEGAAGERIEDAAGATDRMSTATTNLAAQLGQRLNPEMVVLAKWVEITAKEILNWVAYQERLNQVAAEFAQQKGVPQWLLLLPGVPKMLADIDTLLGGTAAAALDTNQAAAKAATDAKAAAKVAADEAEGRAKDAQEDAKTRMRELEDLHKKATQRAIDTENRAYQERKDAIAAQKEAQIKAAEDVKEAALAGIAAEKQASEDRYEAELAQLQVNKEAALDAAEARHTAALRALDAEKDAVQQASELQQRGLKERAEGEERASQDRLRDIKAALEAEDRIRDAARVAEDRALEDQTTRIKQELDDRHEAVVEAIEAEARAVREGAEQELRSVDNQSKAADRRHQKKLRQLDEAHDRAEKNAAAAARALDQEAQAAERARDARVRAIEAEVDAAEERHRLAVGAIEAEKDAAEERHRTTLDAIESERDAAEERHRVIVVGIEAEGAAAEARHAAIIDRIEAEVKAAEDAHRRAVAAIDAEKDAAEAAHAGTIRAIEAEGEAAERAHDGIVGAIKAEEDAAEARHRSVIRGFDDELDAAEALHDREREAIEDLKRAEDDRHDARMRQIKEEQDRQEAFIDAQLGALDEAERREAGANKLAGLGEDLEKALSGGNQAEIAEAQRAILEEQGQQARDALREQLRARQDAVKAAAELAKDAADREHEQAERSISDAREVADAQLDAIKASVSARKQAADDELAQIKAGLSARKDAADDELARIKAVLDARKQSADDELARIKAILDARKAAADEALRLVKEGADARKAAADEELARIKAELDARKAAADEALRLVKEQLDARKDAADEELRKVKEVLDARKVAADEALRLIKADADARKVAAADELQRIKDELAARKLALDDEKAKRQEVYDDAKTKLADQEQREKDALDKKKIRIQDERDAALLALQAKREKEEDDNEELERREGAALTETKRKIQDRRTAEDLAAIDARRAAEETARLEQIAIKDTLDAAVLASKDALDAYTRDYDQRKLVVNAQYKNEQDQIRATFDDPQTGLIPKLKAAFEDTKEWYDRRTTEVNNQYKNEQDRIKETFDDPQTGLFKRLEDVHQKTIDALKDTEETWTKNFKDPILKVTELTIAEIEKEFEGLLKGLKVEGKQGTTGQEKGDGPGPKAGGGGGPGPGGVPSPWRVTFPYDAPYNGPYGGGAMWQGGPPRHQGVDLALPGANNGMGQTYGAFQPGTVYWKGFESAGGNGLIIRTDDGLYNYYGHNQRILVDPGDTVERGQPIGVLGESGTEGSPHLHYAVRRSVNGDHVDPVPYMTGAAAPGGDRELGPGMKIEGGYLVFTLFGRQYRIKLPGGAAAGKVGDWITEALKKSGLPAEWALPLAQIAAVESGERNSDGTVKIGTGNPKAYNPESVNGEHAQGLMQMLPSTFAANFKKLPKGFENDILDPVSNAAAAAMYIKGRYDDPWGTPYFRKGSFDWRGVGGYKHGGYIPEPTLLVGRTLGPYAVAGEVAPEWVTPNAPGGGDRGPLQSAEMPIILGNREVERIWITGYKLNVARGRAMLPSHRRVV